MSNDNENNINKITTLLRKFHIEELKGSVFPELMISWERVKQKLLDMQQLKMNKESIITVLTSLLRKQYSGDTPRLKEYVNKLTLLDLALHHHTHKWTAFVMSKTGAAEYYSHITVQDNLETNFVRISKMMSVAVILHDEVCWMGLTEKVRIPGRGVTYKTPLTIGHFPGFPYLFASAPVTKVTLDAVVKALGYEKAEDANFSGRNIRHVLAFVMKANQKCASTAGEVLYGQKYKSGLYKQTPEGIDFTQEKYRKKYITEQLPKEETVQEFEVVTPSSNWLIEQSYPDLRDRLFGGMEVKFKSPDLVKMFKEGSEIGLFRASLPSYLSAMKKKGVNKITLTAD
ncbi:uncharacterized protein [Periplaneta americana]|uniref:uncharacterized protein isoform X2 n=1 Tax=Periplaneta americana TaxID=6978 RepID=UPI0037E8C93F